MLKGVKLVETLTPMNQAHKRDLILKRLYQHQKAGTPPFILKDLMQELHMYSKPGEEKKFIHLLSPYANIHEGEEGIQISLTDTGMAYVEKHV
jgi:hypothetical protein